MNLSFYIARRYLFSKKSHNAINIISMVSVCGVIVATIALVCALSVYNGFNDLVASLFSNFDPELKVTPRKGKVFDPDASEVQEMKKLPGIASFSEVLQDNALIRYGDRQGVAMLKGVDENYERLTRIVTRTRALAWPSRWELTPVSSRRWKSMRPSATSG